MLCRLSLCGEGWAIGGVEFCVRFQSSWNSLKDFKEEYHICKGRLTIFPKCRFFSSETNLWRRRDNEGNYLWRKLLWLKCAFKLSFHWLSFNRWHPNSIPALPLPTPKIIMILSQGRFLRLNIIPSLNLSRHFTFFAFYQVSLYALPPFQYSSSLSSDQHHYHTSTDSTSLSQLSPCL